MRSGSLDVDSSLMSSSAQDSIAKVSDRKARASSFGKNSLSARVFMKARKVEQLFGVLSSQSYMNTANYSKLMPFQRYFNP